MFESDERHPASLTGLVVVVKNNDVEKAIRILKKKVNDEGILKDLRKKEFYEKPSVKKRRRHAESINRWRKKERMLRDEC
ncbi:MAG: 30S ribosomal protein S21 [Richelia sp. RM2_1_2]|nr:30S ribosomal protein S21 [Richelia sp. RM2_1_2]